LACLSRTLMLHRFVPGRLSDWDIRDKLHHIDVPSLVINGVDDFAQDFVVEPFFRFIPKAKWVRFEKSSHTPFWEERERYNQVVRSFLAF
jgi:pimeloyl-ACP methyl ester carboxylesterase